METRESLMDERRVLRDQLAEWWRRWEAAGGLVNGLMPLDDWARETPEETAARIAR